MAPWHNEFELVETRGTAFGVEFRSNFVYDMDLSQVHVFGLKASACDVEYFHLQKPM